MPIKWYSNGFIYINLSLCSYINGVRLRGTFTSVKRGTKGVQKRVYLMLYEYTKRLKNAYFDKKCLLKG